jgi:hypothetical protein
MIEILKIIFALHCTLTSYPLNDKIQSEIRRKLMQSTFQSLHPKVENITGELRFYFKTLVGFASTSTSAIHFYISLFFRLYT